MAFQNSNDVDASGSSFNEVRDQFNISVIYNFSDMSSESIASGRSSHGSGALPTPVSIASDPGISPPPSRRRKRSNSDEGNGDFNKFGAPDTASTSNWSLGQRIREERARGKRDQLMEGYRTLKNELPASTEKSTKVSLLARGRRLSDVPTRS
jgi:hypothetical protein